MGGYIIKRKLSRQPRRDIAIIGIGGARLSSIGTLVDGFALVAQHVQAQFAPPYRSAMESQVRLLSTSGSIILLTGGRELAADGDLRTPGPFQAAHVAAIDYGDEAGLLALIDRERALVSWLKVQHASGTVLGATGAAVFMLAEAGLLDKGVAAVPHELTALFRRRYPQVGIDTRATVVEHRNIFTTAALATEWQLVSSLVEQVASTNAARWLAVKTGIQKTRDNSTLVVDDPLVAAAQFWLGERFAQPLRIRDMTRELSVSHSTLLRRFEGVLGTTPRRYVQVLRIEAAKIMLAKTSRTIDQISAMVGYSDTRSFRAAFRELTGTSPTEHRATSTRAG